MNLRGKSWDDVFFVIRLFSFEFRVSLESSSFFDQIVSKSIENRCRKEKPEKEKKLIIQHAKYVLYNTLTHYYYMYSKFT